TALWRNGRKKKFFSLRNRDLSRLKVASTAEGEETLRRYDAKGREKKRFIARKRTCTEEFIFMETEIKKKESLRRGVIAFGIAFSRSKIIRQGGQNPPQEGSELPLCDTIFDPPILRVMEDMRCLSQ
ncbi:MAG: hypothetical protein R6V10_15440, partial [bacterium]